MSELMIHMFTCVFALFLKNALQRATNAFVLKDLVEFPLIWMTSTNTEQGCFGRRTKDTFPPACNKLLSLRTNVLTALFYLTQPGDKPKQDT